MSPIFALTLCPILALASHETLTPQAEGLLEKFARDLERDVQVDGIGSIVAGVVVGDELIWSDVFGFADPDSQREPSEETLYRIGSISKSVTAIVLMQLVDRKVVALNDPVARFVPEILELEDDQDRAERITLRQLASHTAGLGREPEKEDAARGPIEDWEAKVLASISTTGFLHDPGAAFAYSNIGFGILGLALSRAAEKPFIALVHELLFEPLDMSSSCFVVPDELTEYLAVGIANQGTETNRELPFAEHAGRGYKVPNGGVYSTLLDLTKLIAALTGASDVEILSPEARAELFRKHTPAEGNGYALGLFCEFDQDGHRRLEHGGSVLGYTAQLTFDPDHQVGAVLLRNYNSGRTNLGSASELVQELARTLPAPR